jgi:hypothetical protein
VKSAARRLTRRSALSVLAMFCTFRPDVLKATPAALTVDLGQWNCIEVTWHGQVLKFTPEEIFKGLQQ